MSVRVRYFSASFWVMMSRTGLSPILSYSSSGPSFVGFRLFRTSSPSKAPSPSESGFWGSVFQSHSSQSLRPSPSLSFCASSARSGLVLRVTVPRLNSFVRNSPLHNKTTPPIMRNAKTAKTICFFPIFFTPLCFELYQSKSGSPRRKMGRMLIAKKLGVRKLGISW